jgi:hypothetical protein
LLGETVEKGVITLVRGPDRKVEGPGHATLGSLPEEFGIRVLGEFIEADIPGINAMACGWEEKAIMREPLSNLI